MNVFLLHLQIFLSHGPWMLLLTLVSLHMDFNPKFLMFPTKNIWKSVGTRISGSSAH